MISFFEVLSSFRLDMCLRSCYSWLTAEIPTIPIWSGDSRFDVLPPALLIHIKFSQFIIKLWKQGGKNANLENFVQCITLSSCIIPPVSHRVLCRLIRPPVLLHLAAQKRWINNSKEQPKDVCDKNKLKTL